MANRSGSSGDIRFTQLKATPKIGHPLLSRMKVVWTKSAFGGLPTGSTSRQSVSSSSASLTESLASDNLIKLSTLISVKQDN